MTYNQLKPGMKIDINGVNVEVDYVVQGMEEGSVYFGQMTNEETEKIAQCTYQYPIGTVERDIVDEVKKLRAETGISHKGLFGLYELTSSFFD